MNSPIDRSILLGKDQKIHPSNNRILLLARNTDLGKVDLAFLPERTLRTLASITQKTDALCTFVTCTIQE
jgi:hypothetical protein